MIKVLIRVLMVFLLLCSVAQAESLIEYDPNSALVANRVIRYSRSGDQSAYLSNPNDLTSVTGNYIIDADLSEVQSVSRKWWKVDNGQVVELLQVEKDIIIAAEAQAVLDAQIASIEGLEVSVKDVIIALIKRINVRIPNNPITKAEVVAQIKEDKGI